MTSRAESLAERKAELRAVLEVQLSAVGSATKRMNSGDYSKAVAEVRRTRNAILACGPETIINKEDQHA